MASNVPRKKLRQDQQRGDVMDLPGWIDKEAWDGFVEMRKRIKAPLTDRAKKLILMRLEGFLRLGQNPNASLDQSTENAWRGVFEVRGSNGPGPGGPRPPFETAKARHARETVERMTGGLLSPRTIQDHFDVEFPNGNALTNR